MESANVSWDARQAEYWRLEGRSTATSQLRGTCLFILICQVAFVGLDYWAFPAWFETFFGLRLAVDVYVLAVLFKWRFEHPGFSQVGVAAAVAAEILAMIYASGQPDTLYFAGLIIVLVGMPVLQPISVRGSLAVSAFCVGGFPLSALLSDASFDQRAFVIQSIFILAGALESVFSCDALSKNRIVTFEQRREIEQARDKLATLDEAKNRFSANVHHELRTPLTLILTPLETLLAGEHGAVGSSFGKTLRTMQVNGRRLLKLINDLLDLAKLESERFDLKRRETRIERVLDPIVEGAGPTAERKQVALRADVAEDVGPICVDRDALEKVVTNLLGNALKFTPAGGEISVEVIRSPEEEGVIVRVRDTGIGLEPADLSRVFDRFAQVDASPTRQHGGTGIGLSLAKELVELHGGRMWAESEGLGTGTSMLFFLPVGLPDVSAEEVVVSEEGRPEDLATAIAGSGRLRFEEEEAAAGHTDGVPVSKPTVSADEAERLDLPRVVIADDNPDMRDLLAFILSPDFRVETAKNGREALEAVRRFDPHLVVTDLMMPEMTGTELCRAIKSDPRLQGIPVMLVSSKAESEMKIEGLEKGADDYVTKPFHPRELKARARGLARIRLLQEALEGRNEELEKTLAELKAAEAQLVESERLAAVGEVAAGIAHEVNNPLNFALNAVRTLRAEVKTLVECALAESSPEARSGLAEMSSDQRREEASTSAEVVEELGEIVLQGLERTRSLVQDLKGFASPKQTVWDDVDLTACVQSSLDLVAPTLSEKGIELVRRIEEDVPSIVGDTKEIAQVVLNLVRNAMEAVATPGGVVEVSLVSSREGVHVVVQDDGPGVAPEMVERMFEAFVTDKPAGVGTGLGLPISRRIIRSHGGELSYTAAEEGGAAFRFSIPLPDPADRSIG